MNGVFVGEEGAIHHHFAGLTLHMRTLIRYAEAIGMKLDVRLVAKKRLTSGILDLLIG